MELNTKITEFLECGEQTPGTICIDNEELSKAFVFKCLGSRISADSNTLVEAEYLKDLSHSSPTCGAVWDGMLADHLKTRADPPHNGNEDASLDSRDHTFGQSAKRKVRSMFGVAPITAKMREARLRWYGYVLRSDDSSVAKSAMNTTVEGRRPRGRPKTR
ncbi:hypothetical protein Y032_0021g336 [Ancylostoma ceylanicum]|uniref:Uncharacterized protein n=1 Tax=Ancylostoma ceylanicum TaxID=53326 RepID=A0A016UZ16_9BILA|nr:hypothetical protein Y032_0021g336 [Ancylostoma ceylanicum]